VRHLLRLEARDFLVQYQDEEHDWITIGSDEELAEAIQVQQSQKTPSLRITISVVTPSSVSPTTSQNVQQNPTTSNPASISIPSENLHKVVLNGTRKLTNLSAKPHLDSCCDIFALQNIPVTKPTAESLQKQRAGLKKTTTRPSPQHVSNWCSNFSIALDLLATRFPEHVQEARIFLKSLLVMDDSTNSRGIFYQLARCESLLGNLQESISYLVKSISMGFTDAKLIEEEQDFIPLKQLEAFTSLLSILKISRQSPHHAGFLQYYLSTLLCVDAGDGEKVKWPIREAEKAAGKKETEDHW